MRTVSAYEMKRRTAMAKAKLAITDAMSGESLTAMEWVNVLNECAARLIAHGLIEEWQEEREGP